MTNEKCKFDYNWTLENANFTKDKGKVFSCFSCGGGSTMGYKLAGYDVIGCNEIDAKLIEVYKMNHHPKYAFCAPIQEFKNQEELPAELYNLDVLDGSPPCSTFSMAGDREKAWGVEKKFREGQKAQVLDTLFFDFIDLAKRLQPKVVIAENVKGMLAGKAIEYVNRIHEEFDKAGYYCQHWLLNASKMGVPQRRERVFFVCLRKDLADQFITEESNGLPYLNLEFDERPIPYKEFKDGLGDPIQPGMVPYWEMRIPSDRSIAHAYKRSGASGSKYFSQSMVKDDEVPPTLTGHKDSLLGYDTGKFMSNQEVLKMSSFPIDYNLGHYKNAHYMCGMSVPPVMMAQVSNAVYEQWLSKLK